MNTHLYYIYVKKSGSPAPWQLQAQDITVPCECTTVEIKPQSRKSFCLTGFQVINTVLNLFQLQIMELHMKYMQCNIDALQAPFPADMQHAAL